MHVQQKGEASHSRHAEIDQLGRLPVTVVGQNYVVELQVAMNNGLLHSTPTLAHERHWRWHSRGSHTATVFQKRLATHHAREAHIQHMSTLIKCTNSSETMNGPVLRAVKSAPRGRCVSTADSARVAGAHWQAVKVVQGRAYIDAQVHSQLFLVAAAQWVDFQRMQDICQ